MMNSVRAGIVALIAATWATAVAAEEPWIVTGDVVISEPMKVEDIIVAPGSSLTVRDLAEPGLQVTGNIWVVGDGALRLENSVIQFMNTYHGQYALAGIEQATIEVIECDYRIPNQVQHALLIFGDGEMVVEDTDFGDVQLISGGDASLSARRLTGNFEILVQDDSTMEIVDIPRIPGEGRIWVWVEFPSGSVADYTPPMPGFISDWFFPPAGSTGIEQRVTVERCEVMLWPMLVREDARLTLRNIPEDNWIVVGLYLPRSVVIDGLVNDLTYGSETLFLNQELHLVNASIDTWNLYPQQDAKIRVRDSLLGEILSFGRSRVDVERTTIDGSGGFLGARDRTTIVLWDSRTTCTIEATHDSTIELHHSVADPYPQDPTGSFTRFGAYDRGRLFTDQTPVNTIPTLGGDGLIAVNFIVNPPQRPPVDVATLFGSVGIFSLGEPALENWRLEAIEGHGRRIERIAESEENVDEDTIAVWSGADPRLDHVLRTVLTDAWGRALVGRIRVPGTSPRDRPVESRHIP
jgi:hypothetical protein